MEQQRDTTEDISNEIEKLADQIKIFAGKNAELYKLKASLKGSDVGADVIIMTAVAVFAALALLLFSFAAAYLISDWLGKPFYGFFIVSGCYLAIGVILFIWKGKGLKTYLQNLIVKKLFD